MLSSIAGFFNKNEVSEYKKYGTKIALRRKSKSTVNPKTGSFDNKDSAVIISSEMKLQSKMSSSAVKNEIDKHFLLTYFFTNASFIISWTLARNFTGQVFDTFSTV